MLKFICSIPPAIGWVLVGIVATLCVFMFIKLLVFIFGEVRKNREEEHRKNTARISYHDEEFEVRVSSNEFGVVVYLYEINPETNKAKTFDFASRYWSYEHIEDLAAMATKTLEKGLRERAEKAKKQQILKDLEKTKVILVVD